MEIVIVSPESRHRDNLISMLESIVLPSTIKIVELCSDVVKIVNPTHPAIIFIDYRDPDLFTEKEISDLILNNAVYFLVLLISRNSPPLHFTHYSSCQLVYNDISVDILENLLKTIQN